MSVNLIYIIGFTAQLLFSARVLVQWAKSEKAGKILSPTIFWQISLVASILFMIYGILRDDLVIILGQFLTYFIYIRNLQFKKAWKVIPIYFRILLIAFPILTAFWLGSNLSHSFSYIINNNPVSGKLMVWGFVGQLIFTARFIFQWYFSEREQKSILPISFWIISLAGATILIIYALFRQDYALFVGHFFGLIVYLRNLFLGLTTPQVFQNKQAIN